MMSIQSKMFSTLFSVVGTDPLIKYLCRQVKISAAVHIPHYANEPDNFLLNLVSCLAEYRFQSRSEQRMVRRNFLTPTRYVVGN